MCTIDYNNLITSIEFYSAIRFDIYLKWRYIAPDEYREQAESGISFLDILIGNIPDYNRCFEILLKEDEINTALSLIRLQADNLRVLYMEYLYPNKILPQIYLRDKQLSDIVIDGKKLKRPEVNKIVDNAYPRFKEILNTYNAYVHPSIKHQRDLIAGTNETKPNYRELALNAKIDMVYINKAIVKTLEDINEYYKTQLEQKPDLYKEWIDFVRFNNGWVQHILSKK